MRPLDILYIYIYIYIYEVPLLFTLARQPSAVHHQTLTFYISTPTITNDKHLNCQYIALVEQSLVCAFSMIQQVLVKQGDGSKRVPTPMPSNSNGPSHFSASSAYSYSEDMSYSHSSPSKSPNSNNAYSQPGAQSPSRDRNYRRKRAAEKESGVGSLPLCGLDQAEAAWHVLRMLQGIPPLLEQLLEQKRATAASKEKEQEMEMEKGKGKKGLSAREKKEKKEKEKKAVPITYTVKFEDGETVKGMLRNELRVPIEVNMETTEAEDTGALASEMNRGEVEFQVGALVEGKFSLSARRVEWFLGEVLSVVKPKVVDMRSPLEVVVDTLEAVRGLLAFGGAVGQNGIGSQSSSQSGREEDAGARLAPTTLHKARELCMEVRLALLPLVPHGDKLHRVQLLCDVLALWGHTSNYSRAQEYESVQSEPMVVVARELGPTIVRDKLKHPLPQPEALDMPAHLRPESSTSRQSFVPIQPHVSLLSGFAATCDARSNSSGNSSGNDELIEMPLPANTSGSANGSIGSTGSADFAIVKTFGLKSGGLPKKIAEFCSGTGTSTGTSKTITNAYKTPSPSLGKVLHPEEAVYCGSKVYGPLFVFWQLMDWFHAGSEQEAGPPDLFGTVQLPEPHQCFGPCEGVYTSKVREKFFELLSDEKAQALPWPKELKTCFSAPTVTFGELVGQGLASADFGLEKSSSASFTEKEKKGEKGGQSQAQGKRKNVSKVKEEEVFDPEFKGLRDRSHIPYFERHMVRVCG